ncbi:MAG: hypothetical protein FJX74_19730 [Armatimonadetes bacterium]|nr:hypothetical protein [Armatimonadota bacterium]
MYADPPAFPGSLSPDDWLLRRRREGAPRWSLEDLPTDAETGGWREGLLADLRRVLVLEDEPRDPPEVRVLARREDRGLTVEHILYEAEPGVTVPAVVLLPHTLELPQPAVVLCPGAEGKAAFSLEPAWSDPGEPGRSLARRLLDENLIVAVPDLVCSGERAGPELPQFAVGGWLGRPLLGRRVGEVLRLVDFLDQRQEVASTRLAVAGLGAGGATALHALALDRRLRVGVVGGMLTGNADRIIALAAGGWRELPECLHLMVPGLAALADVPDIAGLCAPQPLLMVHAADDPACPIDAARDCAALIRAGYARFQGAWQCEVQFHPESGTRAYEAAREFLVRHLRAQYV